MIYLACIVAIMIGCSVLHRRRADPWRLYALGTEIYLLLGVSSVVISRFAPQLIWGFPFSRGGVAAGWGSDNAATFEVFVAPLVAVLLALMAPALICALLWWQQRIGAMLYPSVTRWLYWPIVAGLVLIPGMVTLLLVNGGAHVADPRAVLGLGRMAHLAGIAALVALAALTAWSFLRHFRARR
ncbi:hypothetical protein FIU86_06540 [Roseovarius sp. THAF9]|uniref:hypothetical protein n=1 Tax=Roseovarius sp. THAF9 TaxID=2587847 RepID=UPI001268C0C7|nr:hypothetical protein [Roseovarius sp. THAF9]QFT92491.1 hypothetical protein FIU86_06540 [Roseovarius sp. THAF9]